MKKIALLFSSICFFALFLSCSNTETKDKSGNSDVKSENPQTADIPDSEKGIFKFEEETWAFGTIKRGEIVAHTYKFTNTGKSAIVISSVTASCGCTAPKWPKEPVTPGESAEIKVSFDSTGKSGKLTKSVKIFSNAQDASKELKFTVEVTD